MKPIDRARVAGLMERVRARVYARTDSRNTDVGGIGGTLAGKALSLAAMRATFGEVMTDAAFVQMIALGERFEQGVRGVIESRELPWHVVRLGCRVEYLFRPERARNGAEAAAGPMSTGTRSFSRIWPRNSARDQRTIIAPGRLSESVPHAVASSTA